MKINLLNWYALTCLWMKFLPARRDSTSYSIWWFGFPPIRKYECRELGLNAIGTVCMDANNDWDTKIPPNVPLAPGGALGLLVVRNRDGAPFKRSSFNRVWSLVEEFMSYWFPLSFFLFFETNPSIYCTEVYQTPPCQKMILLYIYTDSFLFRMLELTVSPHLLKLLRVWKGKARVGD